ncbi:MAG TPA: butyrate kinase [candidate division Zixibacteria bacterium]|nr:butyrate kinase [candidate division Zixibacteria bacterium]
MENGLIIINPGSTSTKMALFDGDVLVAEQTIRHDGAELSRFDNVTDQFDFRMQAIDAWIDSLDLPKGQPKAVIGRGAPLRPLEGGTYKITDLLLDDLRTMRWSNHASNLGSIIAEHLGRRYGIPSMIADPVTVDNFIEVARISGVPEIERKCRVHALNIKEVCRREAEKLGKKLTEVNFVAVHMGGGISVAALQRGKVIDVNDALHGMGPFSPDRAGALPIGGLVKLCFSGKYDEKQLMAKLSRESGLTAYVGSSDLREVEKMIEAGDEKALLYFNAMAYQIAKEIGQAAVALAGKFEAIVMTGGMANSRRLVDEIQKYCGFLGKVIVVPGEFEMEALAAAGMRFLRGEEQLKEY